MDERKNRYVRLPNELFKMGLDHNEIAVYAYLLYCEDHRKNLCYPSCSNVGRTLEMCKNTVRKYVASLEEKHLIETEETQVVVRGRKHNGNLKYTFLPLSEAMDCYMERRAVNNRKNIMNQANCDIAIF